MTQKEKFEALCRLTKGHKVVLTQGDYSDYQMCGHFVAAKDFDIREAYQDYKLNLPMVPVMKAGEWHDNPRRWVRYDTPVDTGEVRKEWASIDGFQAYLIRQGLVKEIEVTELHYDRIVGAY
jgi:hypothetical protein